MPPTDVAGALKNAPGSDAVHESVERDSEFRIAKRVLLFVIILWIGLLFFAATVWYLGGIAALGQFGDSFGMLNALFTGITLAGLVYTAFVQQRQWIEQKKAISAQEFDNKLNRQAIDRQARVHFLTARLNGTMAVLQVQDSYIRQLPKAEYDRKVREFTDQTRQIRQQVTVLLHEAELGFEGVWTPSVAEEAIRRFLLRLFHIYQRDCPSPTLMNYGHFNYYVEALATELRILTDQFQCSQPRLCEIVDGFVARLKTIHLGTTIGSDLSDDDCELGRVRFLQMLADFCGRLPASVVGVTTES